MLNSVTQVPVRVNKLPSGVVSSIWKRTASFNEIPRPLPIKREVSRRTMATAIHLVQKGLFIRCPPTPGSLVCNRTHCKSSRYHLPASATRTQAVRERHVLYPMSTRVEIANQRLTSASLLVVKVTTFDCKALEARRALPLLIKRRGR